MNRSLRVASLAGALLSSTALVQAQEEPLDLGTLTLSGSLSPVATEESGASVEILTEEEIATSDLDLISSLDRLPGINSTSNGGVGAASSIQIRGLPSRYVGVRINGIDVSDPAQPQNAFDFGGLTAAGIGRVEVLKGSQSALYGSEAIAGVVDITTFRPEKEGFSGSFGTEAGTNETYSGVASLGYLDDRAEIALTYGRITTDGINAQSGDPNNERDGYGQDTATFYGSYEVVNGLTLGTSIFFQDSTVEYDNLFALNPSDARTSRTRRGYLGFAEIQAGNFDHRLSYGYSDTERQESGASTSRNEGERRELAYLGGYQFGNSLRLNIGLERTEEKFDSGADNASTEVNTAKSEILYSPTESVDLSFALRLDDDSEFGEHFTWRSAAVWRPVEDISFRALIGTGHRAPSLFERFSSFGNPNLDPEESISYELGVEKRFGDAGFIKATWFLTEIDDLIEFDGANTSCGNSFGCYNQIAGTTRSQGVELAGTYRASEALTISGNYTYTDAKTDGARLTRTPRHDLVVAVQANVTDRIETNVDFRYVGDVRPSQFASSGHKVGDYSLVGASISYDLAQDVEAYFRVENLFDEEYETAAGFNQPGRELFVGLRADF